MTKKILVILLLSFITTYTQTKQTHKFTWSELPELPPKLNEEIQPGLAGTYISIYNDYLILAGGANFPDKLPWEGGKKVWYDDIFFVNLNNPQKWEQSENIKLPFSSAYGVTIEDPEGTIFIGGCNNKKCFDNVYQIKFDFKTNSIKINELPKLPVPLAFMTGAIAGNKIFIAGGQESISNATATNNFFMLDLAEKNNLKEFKWKKLKSWNGAPRVLPLSAVQSNGTTDCFYLFSGRNISPNSPTELLYDVHRYNIKNNEWEKLQNIKIDDSLTCIMGGSAISAAANHIFMFSGADGKILKQLESFTEKINSEKNKSGKEKLVEEKLNILNNHRGFSKNILAYHTITDTWIKADELPNIAPVTTKVVKYEDNYIIPSGEIHPGVRTTKIIEGKIEYKKGFGFLNYIVLIVYLGGLVYIGFYFLKREKSTDDFFKAGGRIPWWAAALSIFGTLLSAITFMAIPAKVYASNWSYFTLNASMIIVAPIIAVFILPFYRRLNLTTAYEFLEMRFNLIVRLFGSLVFILFQLGRIGIVLLLPSIALSVVTGIDIYLCITVLGLLSIFYTVLGGIEAVIWTDVLQVIVLMGGAVLSLIVVLFNIDGGVTTFIDIANANNKFEMFNFNLNFNETTFWVILIGGIFLNLLNYGTDQTVIQRYLTTKDEKSAAKSIWVNAILPIISTLLFFTIGTALYVFYKTHPTELNYSISNTDAIYPWYIVTQLPEGIAGILIAAIFSASMSSLDSSMNSIATAFTTDFYKRFNTNVSDMKSLKIARIVTIVVGAIGTLFALVMASWEIKSLWDQFNVIVGLFVGGLGGIFFLGMFTKKANGIGALLGLLSSAVIQFLIKEYSSLNFLLYSASGLISAFFLGYLFSFLIPVKNNKSVSIKKN